MKMRSGEELLTLKDIAAAISFDRSAEGVSRTMRQVRHWTHCDLLQTANEKSTGKGIPRLYAESPTVDIAAILLELSRYGATVDILKPVANELYDSWEGEPYLGNALTEVNSYLQVAWTTDPVTGRFVGAQINFFDDIDRAAREDKLLEDASSSLLVNMSKVLDRVYSP